MYAYILIIQQAVSSPTSGCPIITSNGTTSPPPAIIAKKRMLKSVSLQTHNLERVDQFRGNKDTVNGPATETSQGLLGEIRKMHYLLQQTQDSVNTLQQEKAEHQRQVDTFKKQLKQKTDKEGVYVILIHMLGLYRSLTKGFTYQNS